MSIGRNVPEMQPFNSPPVAGPTFRVMLRAVAMGLVDAVPPRLEQASVLSVLEEISCRNIARAPIAELRAVLAQPVTPSDDIVRKLVAVAHALEQSPVPDAEWMSLTHTIQVDLLADLLDVSATSARRYARGERDTPDHVAARLHLLAMIVADLLGAYNEIGVRRWFRRTRSLLDGRAPADLLQGEWNPDDAGPVSVRELAASLTSSPAT